MDGMTSFRDGLYRKIIRGVTGGLWATQTIWRANVPISYPPQGAAGGAFPRPSLSLLKNPFNYDVLATTNLLGDIVSDLCAQMVGGLGFGCSGNIGDKYAVFEPTHGSAPKYAGKYQVNPIATILAGKLMMDWLGETDKARNLEAAVAAVIKEGKVRTYDMGGDASTIDIARAIAGKL